MATPALITGYVVAAVIYLIPENAVVDFKTKYPSKPQILNGRFARVLSSKDYKQRSFCRFIIPTLEKDMMKVS